MYTRADSLQYLYFHVQVCSDACQPVSLFMCHIYVFQDEQETSRPLVTSYTPPLSYG